MKKLEQPKRMEIIELLREKNIKDEDFIKRIMQATEETYEAVRIYNELLEVLMGVE